MAGLQETATAMNTDLLRKTLSELKDSVATIKACHFSACCSLTQQMSNFSDGKCPATIAAQAWRHTFRHPAAGLR